jgi:hypothetical protein
VPASVIVTVCPATVIDAVRATTPPFTATV